jgi:peptidoglycan hydrolase-like protein with peptidoglycan-binding domain
MASQHSLVKKVQSSLREKGYNPGPIDGVNGSKTKAALRAYQKDNGLVMDGTPNAETLKHLGVSI